MQRDAASSTVLGIHRDAWPVVFGSVVAALILFVTEIGSLVAALLALVEVFTGNHRGHALLSCLVLAVLAAGTLFVVYVIGNTPRWYRASTRALCADEHVFLSLEFHAGAERDGTDAWVRVLERPDGPVLFERLPVLSPNGLLWVQS